MPGRVKIVDFVTKFKGERGEVTEQWLDWLAVAVELTSLEMTQAERTEKMVKMSLFLEDSEAAKWRGEKRFRDNDEGIKASSRRKQVGCLARTQGASALVRRFGERTR